MTQHDSNMPDREERGKTSRRRRRWWIGGALSLLIVLIVVDFFLFPYLPVDGASGNRGQNGLWLRYTWYFGEKTPDDLQRLGRRLQVMQIRDAYFHVRYITPAGLLRFHYQAPARRLTTALHRDAPGVRVFAWIYAGSEHGTPTVDIGNPAIRQRMVREARWLVTACGFDGIQWDYEVCRNNDQRLIQLLKETRAALPAGTPISVCTPLWLPHPATAWYGWDSTFFAQVAQQCDQLAVMAYDSGQFVPHTYAYLLHQQVVQVTRAVQKGNPDCRVIIGVPTYGKGCPAHFAYAENIRIAIKGVREGIADRRTARPVFAGIAPFADYTTEPSEWEYYQWYWLGKSPAIGIGR